MSDAIAFADEVISWLVHDAYLTYREENFDAPADFDVHLSMDDRYSEIHDALIRYYSEYSVELEELAHLTGEPSVNELGFMVAIDLMNSGDGLRAASLGVSSMVADRVDYLSNFLADNLGMVCDYDVTTSVEPDGTVYID